MEKWKFMAAKNSQNMSPDESLAIIEVKKSEEN